jgi:hypothetical protein
VIVFAQIRDLRIARSRSILGIALFLALRVALIPRCRFSFIVLWI